MRCVLLPLLLIAAVAGCGDGDPAPVEAAPSDTGAPPVGLVEVVIPTGAGKGLAMAADDLAAALGAMAGAAPRAVQRGASASAPAAVVAVIDPGADAALGEQGYRIEHATEPRRELRVTGRTEVAAMYGIYRILADLGVLYVHPDEIFVPTRPDATLPWTYDGASDVPAFALRGFHEHTQHPIPMSDYLLRPGVPGFREAASRELKWLARNRQNALTFHLLKTVDMPKWTPYISNIVEEAHEYGIRIGPVVSFADQQQHAYKLLGDGVATPEDVQIRAGLDTVLAPGFDLVGLQIGTSEFTKPDEGAALGWLNVASEHIATAHPGVRPYAWIHITCSVKTDDGGYYFHVPLDADKALGAFVHTTMFYGLTDPAPVYDCQDFTHQLDFMTAAAGQREQVYFPETAWWLGFDNNVPLALPVTGLTREADLRRVLDLGGVTGHVTFTTGREWTYWQLDHYLTVSTWDASVTFDAYLDRLKPLYGEAGALVADATRDVAKVEKKAFLETNPALFFYLAGELPQDEAGATAGVLARPPKLSFAKVLAFDDDAFAAWKAADFDALGALRSELDVIVARLPEAPMLATDGERRFYREARRSLMVTLRRVEHALALYGGVIAARVGDRPAAEAKLAEAKAITADVLVEVVAAEADYREPLELLARAKPETLTAYPFGYLAETSTAYFWTRRDEQLAALVASVFDAAKDAWSVEPTAVFQASGEGMTLVVPSSPVAAGVIGSFLPRLLFGVGAPGADLAIRMARDQNENGLPDGGVELALAAPVAGGVWTAGAPSWTVPVYDDSGSKLADLQLLDPKLTLHPAIEAGAVTSLGTGELNADLLSAQIVATVMAIAGIDQEGIESLVKGVFELDPAAPLPERLHVVFAVTPSKL